MATPKKKAARAASTASVTTVVSIAKAQSIYLRDSDVRRSNKLEYAFKESREVPGRIGMSLVLRAGLKMLADAYEKNPAAVLALVGDVAAEE